MSHNDTDFNIGANLSFDGGYVLDICPLFRLRDMVKAALSFGRDIAFAFAAGSVACDRAVCAIPCQPGGDSDGADYQGRNCFPKTTGSRSQTTRPPISAS